MRVRAGRSFVRVVGAERQGNGELGASRVWSILIPDAAGALLPTRLPGARSSPYCVAEGSPPRFLVSLIGPHRVGDVDRDEPAALAQYPLAYPQYFGVRRHDPG